MRFLKLCALGSGLLLIVSCGKDRFTESQSFAGQQVSAQTLNHGYEQYMLNCYACHGGLQSKEVAIFGPDLGGGTQRLNQKELADALVYPSKQVAQRFKSSLIITGDGRSLSGVITETTENDLTLVDSDNRIQRNAKSNIQSSRPLDTSPMPDKLLNGYSKQQIKDLLRFLESL